MISRKDVLKLTGAGGLALAAARAQRVVAAGIAATGATTQRSSGPADLRPLTTADLRALPRLKPADAIKRTGRTRTFTLAITSTMIEPLAGHQVQARTVNGISPGPLLRMTEGDDIEITVVNRLVQPTSIHWHGLPVPFAMDGSADISQPAIAPGGQFVYKWTAPQAGTYMYHSHYNSIEQDNVMGMIVVDPQALSREPRYDVDFPIAINSFDWESGRNAEAQAVLANSMLMSSMAVDPKADPKPGMGDAMERMDMVDYWCFNGKTFPDTQPIVVKHNDVVRVRFANITHMSHPIHLHGHWFRLIALDGAPLAVPQEMVTVSVDPGRTIDIDFVANNPGVWPLHCHIVSHMADNRDQMSGLFTVVQYEGYPLPAMMRAASSAM